MMFFDTNVEMTDMGDYGMRNLEYQAKYGLEVNTRSGSDITSRNPVHKKVQNEQ